MKRELSQDAEIAQLERRLDIRRERLRRHYDAARTDFLDKGERIARVAGKAVSWVPIVVIAGGLIVGFAASRYPRPAVVAMDPRYATYGPSERTMRSRGTLAAILGIVVTALRIASSNELRTVWRAVSSFRDRRRR